MKKFILGVVLIAVASVCHSQGLEFSGQDEITYGQPSSIDIPSYITVQNNSDQTRNIKVRRNPIDILDGTSNWFCWVLCWQDIIDTSSYSLHLDPGEVTEEFSAHINPGGQEYGNWLIEYCFYDVNDPEFEYCTVVHWSTADPLSTEDLSDSKLVYPQPNPCSDIVRFNILNEKLPTNSVLSIFSVVGEKIKEQRIQSGVKVVEMDVNDLSPGVYIYSLTNGGNKLNSGRLIVK